MQERRVCGVPWPMGRNVGRGTEDLSQSGPPGAMALGAGTAGTGINARDFSQ